MAESESFTSLLDMVQSHLSKTSLQSSVSDPNDRFRLPNLNDIVSASSSETGFPSPGQSVGFLNTNSTGSSVTDVLGKQLENTFKARQLKLQQEKEKKEKAKENSSKTQKDDYIIDLTDAIIYPQSEEFKKEGNMDVEDIMLPPKEQQLEPELPNFIVPDLSYILTLKLPNKKECSSFGRVVCSKYRVHVPVKRELYPIPPTIKEFDFSTMSPDDINIENMKNKKPVCPDIFDILGIDREWFMDFKK